MRANRWAGVVVVFLVLVFAYGVVRLFNLRFAAGDIYPPYSSLRSDPLGCQALLESIGGLSGYRVSRNYLPVARLAEDGHRTIFFFGVPAEEMLRVSESESREIQQLLFAGNRLVISVLPVLTAEDVKKTRTLHLRKPKVEKKKTGEKDEESEVEKPVLMEPKWGFKAAYAKAATNELWHSTLYFDELKPGWKTLATRGKYPAIVERQFGGGSLVLCADSYFVSNEAMRQERQPELLAQLLGANHEIVFDEVHLGVTDTPGVMTLARRYGLHGLIAGLLVLAGLYVWKSAANFLPPYPDKADVAVATGKDSLTGFVNLLRRSIPASRVLSVCVEEWRKTVGSTRRDPSQKLERIAAVAATQEALPIRQRDPVAGYRSIAEILKERK